MLTWHKMPSSFRLLIFQTTLAVIAITVGAFYFFKRLNNAIFFNFYMALEFLLLFFSTWSLLAIRRKSIYTTSCIIIFFTIWFSSLLIDGLNVFANWALVMSCIITATTYLLITINTLNTTGAATKKGLYFICFSIILYHCCDIPLFSAYGYLLKNDRPLLNDLFFINRILSLIRYSFIAVGFMLLYKSSKNSVASPNF